MKKNIITTSKSYSILHLNRPAVHPHFKVKQNNISKNIKLLIQKSNSAGKPIKNKTSKISYHSTAIPQNKHSNSESSRNQFLSMNDNIRSYKKSQASRKNSNSRSMFLTEHDEREKTKILWRQSKSPKHPNKHTSRSSFSSSIQKLMKINSKKDLERLKNRYNTQILRNKSKDQIMEENINMIMKIEDLPPKVESWNFMPKKKVCKFTLQREDYEQLLFAKNMQMIQKIENTPPRVDAWNYYRQKKSPRARDREQKEEQLFQENMKMIDRIENTPPRIDSWNTIGPKRNKKSLLQKEMREQQLFEENMNMIQKIENTPPKVEAWLYNKNVLEHKVRKAKNNPQEREKILEKMRLFIIEEEKKYKDEEQLKNTSNTNCFLERIPEQRKRVSNKRYKTVPSGMSPRKSPIARKMTEKYSNFSNINSQNSRILGVKINAKQRSNVEEIKLKMKAKRDEAHYFHLFRMAQKKKY